MSAEYNITINKHSDFKRTFQIKEDDVILDITDYTFAGSLRENYTESTSVDFVTAITDAGAGLFTISLTDVVTATMDPGTWVYDVVMTNTAGEKTRLFGGKAFVRQGATR